MKTLSRDVIKRSVLAMGHQWFDHEPMIVGIRATQDIPDAFNDILTLSMPDGTFVGLNATTDPGVYYLNNPERVTGTAIVKEGQYLKSHVLGYHGSGLRRHRAWQQKGIMLVYRDGNKDSILQRDPKTLEKSDYRNGINIHSCVVLDKLMKPLLNWIAPKIWNWSAGCQVAPNYGAFKSKMTDLCDKWEKENNKIGMEYSYTLLLENEII